MCHFPQALQTIWGSFFAPQFLQSTRFGRDTARAAFRLPERMVENFRLGSGVIGVRSIPWLAERIKLPSEDHCPEDKGDGYKEDKCPAALA